MRHRPTELIAALWRLRHRAPLAALLLTALLAAGCPQDTKPKVDPPSQVAAVDHIDLWVPNAVANLDGEPDPDGVKITMMFYRDEKPQSVAVGGTVEVMLFEGTVARRDLAATSPFHVWSFSGSQMKRYLTRIYGVWAYSMTLTWGDQVPSGGRSNRITLVARYRPPRGEPVWSQVGYVPLGMGEQ
jgi:hypothetical protein